MLILKSVWICQVCVTPYQEASVTEKEETLRKNLNYFCIQATPEKTKFRDGCRKLGNRVAAVAARAQPCDNLGVCRGMLPRKCKDPDCKIPFNRSCL